MTIEPRDKRALMLLVPSVVVILAIHFWPSGQSETTTVAAVESVPVAEKRLEKLRTLAAQVPGKEEALRQATAELAKREKGLIQADTAAQAQAQLLQILRGIGRRQAPPVEIRSSELGVPKLFGQDYGLVSAAITFECRIEMLVNLLSDLSAQPELIATDEVRVVSGNSKEKTISVRINVFGLVPKRLVPEKRKDLAAF